MSLRIALSSVKLRRAEFDLEGGLLRSSLLPWVPVAVDSGAAMEYIAGEAPIDGVEVVEWMHYSASDQAVFGAMADEYNRLGSQLLSGSGDAYIPGVMVGDLRGQSIPGREVASRGYIARWWVVGELFDVGCKAFYLYPESDMSGGVYASGRGSP